MQAVIGNRQAILSIADLLENLCIQFKVEPIPGTATSQEHMGVSGYRFWLRPEERHCPDGFDVAISSEDAIYLTQIWGMPEFISFDHDLGRNDTAIVYIRWLIENLYDSDIPGYEVHSENPVGRMNIVSLMDSWKKSRSL
jgi:hypothetical protein